MIKARTLQDLFKRYRRPGDLVFSIVFLIFSLLLALSLGSQNVWTSNDRLFSQPAFWSYLSVYTMLGFSILHLISGLLSPALDGRWSEVGFWLRSGEFAIWFMVYVVVVPMLGYLPATLLFSVVLVFRLGYRSKAALWSAAGFSVVVVVLFKTFLQVKVPGGAIYDYLPTAARSFMLTYF
ncbi:MAG: tripartite tricarboxylate transporter TctB family protein [Sulfitobacter sp.]